MARTDIEKVAVLRATNLFGNVPEAIVRVAAGLTVTLTLKRGEVLCSEREEVSSLYVVASGELRSIRQSPQGKEQVLSTERTGAILGAVAMFNGGKLYSTLIADSSSEILAIGKREIHSLCRQHAELLWNVASILADKLRNAAELIGTLALLTVDQRVAQYLLTVCQQRGLSNSGACLVELTMNRTEIANCVGSAREVVSRALTQLEKDGLIRMQGRRLITIPDMRSLRIFAGTEVELNFRGFCRSGVSASAHQRAAQE